MIRIAWCQRLQAQSKISWVEMFIHNVLLPRLSCLGIITFLIQKIFLLTVNPAPEQCFHIESWQTLKHNAISKTIPMLSKLFKNKDLTLLPMLHHIFTTILLIKEQHKIWFVLFQKSIKLQWLQNISQLLKQHATGWTNQRLLSQFLTKEFL